MGWVHGQRYRGRAVSGQLQVEKNSKTGTPAAVGLIEVTLGPQLGQRLRWRGYLNSETNAEVTIGELRAMGWRGARLGSWEGVGSKEVEFTLMVEAGTDGKTYYRAAFIRPVTTLKEEKAVGSTDLDDLQRRLGGLLSGDGLTRGPVPSPPDDDFPPTDPADDQIGF